MNGKWIRQKKKLERIKGKLEDKAKKIMMAKAGDEWEGEWDGDWDGEWEDDYFEREESEEEGESWWEQQIWVIEEYFKDNR